MLKQRVITALVLAAALVAAVVSLDVPGLALVFGAVVLICAWEWAALAGYERIGARLGYAAVHAGDSR